MVWLSVLLSLIAPEPGRAAYPVERPPLRFLQHASDLIVVGAPTRYELVLPEGGGIHYGRRVTFSVERVLKGAGSPASISIFIRNLSCPEPLSIPPDRRSLLFLERAAEVDGYRSVAFSYGQMSLSDLDLALYEARIRDLNRIDAIQDPREKTDGLTRWLVRCMEADATRWEGAEEFRSLYMVPKEGTAAPPVVPVEAFTPSQRERLIEVFLKAEFLGQAEIVMARNVLRHFPDDRVDKALLDALGKAVRSGNSGGQYYAFVLQERIPLEGGDDLLTELIRVPYGGGTKESFRLSVLNKYLKLAEQRRR
jgi:hypothetical protein